MILPFLERARRRYLRNEMLEQSAFATALLLGGAVLLLLLGTQLLDWRVVLALCAAGAATVLYRTYRKLPSPYRIAVLVDHRAGLNDALSTAFHFENVSSGSHSLPAIREIQKRHAARLIPAVDLRTALPLRTPRALYIVFALAVAAGGLFALRYGIRRSLDFEAPLSQVVMDGLGLRSPDDKAVEAKKKRSAEANRNDTLDNDGMPKREGNEKHAGKLDAAPPSALETVNDPDVNNEKAQSASAGKEASTKQGSGEESGEKTGAEQASGGKPEAGKNTADTPAGSQEGPPQGEQSQSQQGGQGNNSSLLSKMKDAMQNLLSKAKPQPNNAQGQKPNGAQGQQKGQSQQAKAGEKGTQGESKEGGQQEGSAGEQGQQAGDQDKSDDGQGKGNGKSSEQQAAAQPGSGVGKQDGAKDIKAAEQRAAMGKLTEVIGKRAANVSGEMMVESQSGPQQLRTQYSRRNAIHSEAGGEVNRDEIPVELQGYVQQYFEEVRKRERNITEARPSKVK